MLPFPHGASMNASAVAQPQPIFMLPACPKCNGFLVLQDVIDPLEDQSSTWEYRCLNCGHQEKNSLYISS